MASANSAATKRPVARMSSRTATRPSAVAMCAGYSASAILWCSGGPVTKTKTTPAGTVVTRYAYANGRLAAALDAQGNVTQRYLYGAGGALVGVIDAAGHLSTVLTDAAGSVRDVIGPGGTTHTDCSACSAKFQVGMLLFPPSGVLPPPLPGLALP